MTLVGRLAPASNVALLVEVGREPRSPKAIYKPVTGERPLWDFPHGTLAGRERAAYLLSVAGGWDLVPPTVLRDGPLGIGSVQAWVGDPEIPGDPVIDVVPPDAVPEGFLPVFSATDEDGRDVVVVHADLPGLKSAAVFDAVINNGDRKGSHLVLHQGRVVGFDHGVSFHTEPKLRTVLWGWAGEDIVDGDVDRLVRCRSALDARASGALGELPELLTESERESLTARIDALLASRRMPVPTGGWPAIPWPPL